MVLMRSGMVLFVSVTLVAALILGALLVGTGNIGGWQLDTTSDWTFLFHLSIVTLPTSVLLITLAWRGRRQPLADGVTLMTCIAVAVSFFRILIPSPSSSLGRGFDIFAIWAFCGIGLMCVVPAYVLCYLALRRTPLLRGLAPPRKSKGPAEASPS